MNIDRENFEAWMERIQDRFDMVEKRLERMANIRNCLDGEELLDNQDLMMITKAQITAEGGYYYKFLSDASQTLFFSIGGSVLAGYETSNWGDKLLFDGATLRNKDAFIYGGAITFEIETYLSDKIVLLLNARERALWGSSIGKFATQFGCGIKFIIN